MFSSPLSLSLLALPTLFYSVGSPLPQAKHHHPLPPLPLAAFPTQSDRRAAASAPGRAIPRRFRAIRGSSRGFSANRRGSGLPAGGQAPSPSPPIANPRCSVPAAWGGGLPACVPPVTARAALPRCDEQMSELFCFYNWCWVGSVGERFRDRGAVCCVSMSDVRSGLWRGTLRARVPGG